MHFCVFVDILEILRKYEPPVWIHNYNAFDKNTMSGTLIIQN